MDGVGAETEIGSARVGEGGSLLLALDGFHGPLDHLLGLARSHRINLATLSLRALVDQLVAALRLSSASVLLSQKGDWLVMAAWLVQLRSVLLLPANSPARRTAVAEADQLRSRLLTLQHIQGLAAWLDRQPVVGRDVFARGQLEPSATPDGVEIDVVAFLWACMALFDDDTTAVDPVPAHRPARLDWYSVVDARARILRLLESTPDGGAMEGFLPAAPAEAEPQLRRRSVWAATLMASLELARQGELVLAQDGVFGTIRVRRVSERASDEIDPAWAAAQIVSEST
jgi:segregation and condensation protein A